MAPVVNLNARPAAGALGIFTLPARGMYRSAIRKINRVPEKVLFHPRIEQSEKDASVLTEQEKRDIINKFRALEKETKIRKDEVERKTKRWLLTGEMLESSGTIAVSSEGGSTLQSQIRSSPPPPPPKDGYTFTGDSSSQSPAPGPSTIVSRSDVAPPEYDYEDTKCQYIDELDSQSSHQRAEKDKYLSELDSQRG